jgi:hypothetical protein
VRVLPVVFVVTLKLIGPDPVSAVFVVIHVAVVVATHVQADPVLTYELLELATADIVRDVGFNV